MSETQFVHTPPFTIITNKGSLQSKATFVLYYNSLPWQFLNFLPLPQGQGVLMRYLFRHPLYLLFQRIYHLGVVAKVVA